MQQHFRDPLDYYDSFYEREKKSAWWRVAARYIFSVISFFLLMGGVIAMYWTWDEYSLQGPEGISLDHLKQRAEFRWQELRHGRIGLD